MVLNFPINHFVFFWPDVHRSFSESSHKQTWGMDDRVLSQTWKKLSSQTILLFLFNVVATKTVTE